MEIKLKPLRALVKLFYRKPIPPSSWTPALIKLFADLKVCITSSPVLARYDTTRPIYIKTDWSSEGMEWILILIKRVCGKTRETKAFVMAM